MRIKFGHRVPDHTHPVETAAEVIDDPRVDTEGNPTGEPIARYIVGTSAQEIKDHLQVEWNDNPLVTHLPGNEALIGVLSTLKEVGLIGVLGQVVVPVDWVDVDAQQRDPAEAEDVERFFADYFGCARGRPDDVEDTHHTMHGSTSFAPGDRPEES